jgi:predicted RNase H-like nuclease (RuvC/YqgF family)
MWEKVSGLNWSGLKSTIIEWYNKLEGIRQSVVNWILDLFGIERKQSMSEIQKKITEEKGEIGRLNKRIQEVRADMAKGGLYGQGQGQFLAALEELNKTNKEQLAALQEQLKNAPEHIAVPVGGGDELRGLPTFDNDTLQQAHGN